MNFTYTDHEILKYLSQFLTVTEISKLRKTSSTAVYKTIFRLIKTGQIRKIGKGYELTEIGLCSLNRSLPDLIRLHNLAIKVRITRTPQNWELKRSQIVQIRTLSKQVDLNNSSYEIHNFSRMKIKTSSNSVIFYFPALYGKNTDDCFKQALEMLWDNIPKIENLFKIALVKDYKTNIEIISQHYAKLQDSIAKIYHNEGNKLYVKDEEGNLRIIADYSFRVDELEAVYNKTAKEDMDIMQTFIQDLIKNPLKLSELQSMIGQVTANQLMFAKNMESHIDAVKTLSKSVKKLTKTIGGIVKENKALRLGPQKTLQDF